MKKLSLICCLIITPLLFNACKSYNEDEIKIVTNNFLDGMHKPVDWEKMKENFHEFNFTSIPRADKHSINSIKEINGEIIADITTTFTDTRSKRFTNKFLLKFGKINEEWMIVDSKGVSNIENFEPNAYEFAEKSNLLNDDLWDVEVFKIVEKAKKELKDIQKGLKEMAIQNAKANEMVKKSDISAAKAHKAFEEFEAKNNN